MITSATLGLGFHDFRGTNATISEVVEQIGANFEVEKQHLVRIPNEIYDMVQNGQDVDYNITLKDLINSHCATINKDTDRTIGVVGSDYGVIQNQDALAILDLLITGNNNVEVVSAGMVEEHKPYIQVKLGEDAYIHKDNSPTEFYAFISTSHNGTSGLKFAFTPIRVICGNTFVANMRDKNGFNIKHSKYVGDRIRLDDQKNVEKILKLSADLNFFKDTYIEKMKQYAQQNITETDINKFIANMFISDKANLQQLKANGYNFKQIELSTRLDNIITNFRDTLESGIGQDTNRGTKLWLFNGLTNYYSNVQKSTSAEKKFLSLMDGAINKKYQDTYHVLDMVA